MLVMFCSCMINGLLSLYIARIHITVRTLDMLLLSLVFKLISLLQAESLKKMCGYEEFVCAMVNISQQCVFQLEWLDELMTIQKYC